MLLLEYRLSHSLMFVTVSLLSLIIHKISELFLFCTVLSWLKECMIYYSDFGALCAPYTDVKRQKRVLFVFRSCRKGKCLVIIMLKICKKTSDVFGNNRVGMPKV